jgi:rubrerythrin
MDDVNLFLAHAIQLERDAARRFEDLMHSMQTAQNREVEGLFRRLGEFSRQHLKAAMARGGFRTLPELSPADFQWPEGVTPEAAGWHGVDQGLDVLGALMLALEGERSGHAYYDAIARSSGDPEVVRMARSFAEEEAQHVSELERWVARFAS